MSRYCRQLTFFILVIGTVIAPVANAANDNPVEVIELHHRPASEVIPLIKPFLDANSAVSGTGFELIVRTSPANLRDVRNIISHLDRSPRQLLISVRQTRQSDDDLRSGQVSGSVPVGEHGKITLPDAENPDRNESDINARITRTASRDNDDDVQQLRVLEGRAATIRVGQSVPVVTGIGHHQGVITGSHAKFEYKDVTVGLDVLPRVNDDIVTLEIRPHRADIDPANPAAINVQQLYTTVSGRLGEWIEIGGVSQLEEESQQGIAFTARTRDAENNRVLLKVTEIPD